MKFDISGLTNVGTVRTSNQDRILVNGFLLSEGEVHLAQQDHCLCFVADGVGGNRAGDFASQFVLEQINSTSKLSNANFEMLLGEINRNLLGMTAGDGHLAGAATTLTGLVIDSEGFLVVHCGDSQLWLLRNGMLFKVTNDHVLDEFQENSPITSFFGGSNDNFQADKQVFVDGSIAGDVFLICSDGLFKSLSKESVKLILLGGGGNQAKARELMQKCLLDGADDNVSIVLIGRID